jgi:hypothetical protein
MSFQTGGALCTLNTRMNAEELLPRMKVIWDLSMWQGWSALSSLSPAIIHGLQGDG